MARLPRFDLPGIPQHIVQRGNNRLPCFLDDQDRQCYLSLLRQAALTTNCQIHAYVLMDNHVHMLVTPPEAGSISRMMQALGRGYTCSSSVHWAGTPSAAWSKPGPVALLAYGRLIGLGSKETLRESEPDP